MLGFLTNKDRVYLFLALLVITLFAFSVNYSIFNFYLFHVLNLFTNSLNAYLLDQLLFVFIFFVVLILMILKKKLILNIRPFITFFFILATLLFFQDEVLVKYFIKEDYYLILGPLNKTLIDPGFNLYENGFYKIYPYLSFAILFKLFRLSAFYYNITSLALMALNGLLLYKLLLLLIPISGFKNKIIPLLLALIYITSPIIMEIYVWVQGGHANGYIVAGMLSSLFFYLKFIRTRDITFFVLSLLLVLFLLKTAFVRAAVWPLCLVFLDLLYIKKKSRELVNFLFRAILLLLPLGFLILNFLIKSTSQTPYTIGERMYIFFYDLVPSLIPYQFYSPSYEFLTAFLEFHGVSNGFVYNNLFFIFGALVFVLITVITLNLQRKGVEARMVLYFWFCSFAFLAFFTLFGNWGMPSTTGSADSPLINYAVVPGSRYYTYTYLFLLITVYLQFSTISRNSFRNKYLLITLLVLLLVSNIIFTQKIQKGLNEAGPIPLKAVTKNVLNMVPDINEPRILYSVGKVPESVKSLGYDSFDSLFKYPPINVYSEEELISSVKKNKVAIESVYAYSFDEKNLLFEDKSLQIREKFKVYLY